MSQGHRRPRGLQKQQPRAFRVAQTLSLGRGFRLNTIQRHPPAHRRRRRTRCLRWRRRQVHHRHSRLHCPTNRSNRPHHPSRPHCPTNRRRASQHPSPPSRPRRHRTRHHRSWKQCACSNTDHVGDMDAAPIGYPKPLCIMPLEVHKCFGVPSCQGYHATIICVRRIVNIGVHELLPLPLPLPLPL